LLYFNIYVNDYVCSVRRWLFTLLVHPTKNLLLQIYNIKTLYRTASKPLNHKQLKCVHTVYVLKSNFIYIKFAIKDLPVHLRQTPHKKYMNKNCSFRILLFYWHVSQTYRIFQYHQISLSCVIDFQTHSGHFKSNQVNIIKLIL